MDLEEKFAEKLDTITEALKDCRKGFISVGTTLAIISMIAAPGKVGEDLKEWAIKLISERTERNNEKHVPDEYDNCEILEDCFCGDCGWPVIDVCCNGTFQSFKDANEWDWWQYCSNKGCKNHDGEGVFQDKPEWVFRKGKS